ncbi:hypothetical protein RR51_25205 [Pseudomonas sp. C5pp]|nr:hypothetical protein [Pseudomonas sp. C5pp]KIC79710.1 hypothetical protein RR51_25205 [Pseudomonas sp. C5pp]
MNVPTSQLVLGVLALAAVGYMHFQRIENNAQTATIEQLKQAAEVSRTTIASQAEALNGFKQLQQQVTDLNANSLAAFQSIGAGTAGLANELQELKRHDQTIADYLRGTVPVAVGMRWQRSASTEPGTYRQTGGAMPANAVPTPRARADPDQ